jgi:hypothetical protein
MERFEPLEVRTVARFVDVQQRHHRPRLLLIAPNAAGRLDILCRRLRLAENHHQPKPRDVEADGNHVRGQRDIYPFVLRREIYGEPALCIGHGGRRFTRRQLRNLPADISVDKRTFRIVDPPLTSVIRNARRDFILDDATTATELSEAVEIPTSVMNGSAGFEAFLRRRLQPRLLRRGKDRKVRP